MTTLILLVSIVMKTASIISSPEKSAAFISPDVDQLTKTSPTTTLTSTIKSTLNANTLASNPHSFAALPVTLNMMAQGAKSLGGSKRTFIPSMSVAPKSNFNINQLPDIFPMFSQLHDNEYEHDFESNRESRRNFLSKLAAACVTTASATSIVATSPAFAVDTNIADSAPTSPINDPQTPTLFSRSGKGFEYSFLPPAGFKPSNKPLKTHLDEINFSLEGLRGYQYGITVDPVRIQSLQQFGTPDQVAARVVDAEANRDGITDVKLVGTPTEDPKTGIYAIDYVSEGSRGTKHFVTRIAVYKEKLYVLTAQVKEKDFDKFEQEILETVKTFQVL